MCLSISVCLLSCWSLIALLTYWSYLTSSILGIILSCIIHSMANFRAVQHLNCLSVFSLYIQGWTSIGISSCTPWKSIHCYFLYNLFFCKYKFKSTFMFMSSILGEHPWFDFYVAWTFYHLNFSLHAKLASNFYCVSCIFFFCHNLSLRFIHDPSIHLPQI